MRTIKGVLITPSMEGTKPRVYELKYKDYKSFYPLLNCSTFDITARRFKGEYLDIYCDDEGLLKEGNKENPSIITVNKKGEIESALVGNVFIVGHDEEGNTISLTNKQIDKVLKSQAFVSVGEKVKTVCVCEW